MKATEIPLAARTAVLRRERFRCARCAIPSPSGHWHHRRSRSVRDEHTHHPCNGVLLCAVCHAWVHAHPEKARNEGWIVSRYTDPGRIPFKTPTGWVLPACDGTWSAAL